MDWDGNLLRLNGLLFSLAHLPDAKHPEGAFVVRKPRPLLEHLLACCESPKRILELGTAGGGSAVLFYEYFRPAKLVTIDQDVAELPPREGLRFYRADQANTERLREIVNAEFDGPLDLVIDDCSHLYGPTKASFDLLFPLLRDGGVYAIEDWNWELMPTFQAPHPWAGEKGLVALIDELVRRIPVDVRSLEIRSALAIVRRYC